MATLIELKEEILKGRKVKRKVWNSDSYHKLGFYTAYPDNIFADDWELEPLPKAKKKITMYQFIFKRKGDESFYISAMLYKSEEHFNNIVIDAIIIKTIPHEIEVEE